MPAKAGLGFFIFLSDTMLSSSGLIIKSGIQIMSVQSQSVFFTHIKYFTGCGPPQTLKGTNAKIRQFTLFFTSKL